MGAWMTLEIQQCSHPLVCNIGVTFQLSSVSFLQLLGWKRIGTACASVWARMASTMGSLTTEYGQRYGQSGMLQSSPVPPEPNPRPILFHPAPCHCPHPSTHQDQCQERRCLWAKTFTSEDIYLGWDLTRIRLLNLNSNVLFLAASVLLLLLLFNAHTGHDCRWEGCLVVIMVWRSVLGIWVL